MAKIKNPMITASRLHQLNPPSVNDRAIRGTLATMNIMTLITAEKTFPMMICLGLMTVVSMISKV